MPNQLRLDEKGVTLIEVMITIGIIAFTMSIIVAMSFVASTSWQKQLARVQMERQARASMDIISFNLRQASASTVVIDQIAGESPLSRVTFSLPNQSGVTYSIFQQSSTVAGQAIRRLYFQQPVVTAAATVYGKNLLAENVQQVFFTYPQSTYPDEILVNLTLKTSPFKKSLKNSTPVVLHTMGSVDLRNP